jgi:glycosyltransferase involved in cell wall biosynthesis
MHLVAYLESSAFGGAEAVLRGVVGAAADRHRVTVVCPYTDVGRQVAALSRRIDVVTSPVITGKFDLGAAAGLRRTLRRLQPDVVHVNLTDMAACLAAISVLGTMPGVGLVVAEHAAHPPQSAFQRAAKRLSTRRMDAHIAVSSTLAALVAAVTGEPLEHITVIPNGADEVAPYGHPPHAGGAVRVGVVTRLTRDKGVDVLLDAVAGLDGVEVHVAGDGPARAELEAQIDRLGLGARVRLLGWLDRPEALYRSVDVLVHPSRADIAPMSIIEAMHHGLPVVATAVGGIPDLIDPGVDGLLFPLDDVAACRAAVESLRDPAERERLGAAARVRAVARYSSPVQHAAYLAVYEAARRSARNRGRLGWGEPVSAAPGASAPARR